MLLSALIVALTGFFAIKFIILITVSNDFGCNYCSCRCSTFKHGLTKLWHIAICQHLINPVSRENSCVKDGSCDANFKTRERESNIEESPNGGEILTSKPDNTADAELINHHCYDAFYQKLIKEDIPNDVIDDVEKGYKNCCRSTIPYILLTLLVTILFLAYLSFDLHPLACITKSEEQITYDHEKNAVELEFSDELSTYQTIAGYLCLGLGLIFLACVKIFFAYTRLVVNDLQQCYVEKYCNN